MQMIRAAHQASYLRHGMMKNSSHNRFTCTDMIRFMVNTLQKAKLEKRLKFMSQLSFRLKRFDSTQKFMLQQQIQQLLTV